MTLSQRLSHEQFWPLFGIEPPLNMLNFEELYQRSAPTILEIGFGMGGSLVELAEKNPEINFLGIEVHKPGIGALLFSIQEKQLSNLKVICGDAKEWLNQHIADHSLAAILLFFPDPWPKRRQQKRRIVQTPFVDLVQRKLEASGYFHLATDVMSYADHMRDVMSKHQGFGIINTAGISLNLIRPKTKFEQKGERLGHTITDLIYRKTI